MRKISPHWDSIPEPPKFIFLMFSMLFLKNFRFFINFSFKLSTVLRLKCLEIPTVGRWYFCTKQHGGIAQITAISNQVLNAVNLLVTHCRLSSVIFWTDKLWYVKKFTFKNFRCRIYLACWMNQLGYTEGQREGQMQSAIGFQNKVLKCIVIWSIITWSQYFDT